MQNNNITNSAEKEESKDELKNIKKLFSIFLKHKFKIIFFALLMTSKTIIKILDTPEQYECKTILLPQNEPKLSFVNALGSISVASMTSGEDKSGSKLDPAISMQVILNDIEFEKYMLKKYNLTKLLKPKRENLIFPFGYDGVYNYMNKLRAKLHKHKKKKPPSEAKTVLSIHKKINKLIAITKDKKTGLITIKITYEDRFLAKKLIDIYLKELTGRMRDIEMQNVNNQMKYYKIELRKTMDVFMRKQLLNLISGLLQKKVLSLANPLYNVFQLEKPRVPYVEEKLNSRKPLRIIVSFSTSLALGIFIAFLAELALKKIRELKEKKNKEKLIDD